MTKLEPMTFSHDINTTFIKFFAIQKMLTFLDMFNHQIEVTDRPALPCATKKYEDDSVKAYFIAYFVTNVTELMLL